MGNDQVHNGQGYLWLSYDGDADLVGPSVAKRNTLEKKMGDDWEADPQPADHDDAASHCSEGFQDHVPKFTRSWTHFLVCVSRARYIDTKGYVHSAIPCFGIALPAENQV